MLRRMTKRLPGEENESSLKELLSNTKQFSGSKCINLVLPRGDCSLAGGSVSFRSVRRQKLPYFSLKSAAFLNLKWKLPIFLIFSCPRFPFSLSIGLEKQLIELTTTNPSISFLGAIHLQGQLAVRLKGQMSSLWCFCCWTCHCGPERSDFER